MRQWEYTTHEERRVLLSAASTSINNRSTRTLWWKTESALEQSAPLPGMVLAYLLFRQAVVLAIKGRGRFLPLSLSLSQISNLFPQKYQICGNIWCAFSACFPTHLVWVHLAAAIHIHPRPRQSCWFVENLYLPQELGENSEGAGCKNNEQ